MIPSSNTCNNTQVIIFIHVLCYLTVNLVNYTLNRKFTSSIVLINIFDTIGYNNA